MKHTPAPWIIISTQDHKSALIKGNEHVAAVDLDQNQDGEANAYLIAAAPDNTESNIYMTSIVNKCIEVLQSHIVPDGISDAQALQELYGILDNAEIVERLKKSESAIAKAKGL